MQWIGDKSTKNDVCVCVCVCVCACVCVAHVFFIVFAVHYTKSLDIALVLHLGATIVTKNASALNPFPV